MKLKAHYDVVIIGSGLGGLVSAIILAKEGKRVCVLEKNNQYGGNLQTFVRDKSIFDTGVHYIGGLSKGQNLYHYFDYIGIMKDLKLHKMDEVGFDTITFDNDEMEYPYAQGYPHFIKTLSSYFPEEKEAIVAYCDKLKATCDSFPLYRLTYNETDAYDTQVFQLSVREYLESITSNKKLQAVLAGTNFLYAGDGYRTPFYVHALSVNSYIQSSYRCVNGGSQITKSLIKRLKENDGEVYNHQEVTRINCGENGITSVETAKGDTISANIYISNIEPKLTLDLIGKERFRKAYYNRVKNIESVIGCFSLYLVLKKDTFPYLNKNYYHFKDKKNVWNAQHYNANNWPESYMLSMGVNKNTDKYAENITVMTYMRFEEVTAWKNSFNTVADKNERGQNYDEFKSEKAEQILNELEKKFPNIRECIQSVHSSSPLSYRDYIGSHEGAIYGYVKDVNSPMASYISAKTKIKNLFFTGQSLSMHGILGVTIGAVVSCSVILGKKYLLEKILEHNTIQEVN